MTPVLIGVTGGIGAGKSVVCRVCALRGIPVYDCDSRAKAIMEADPRVRRFVIAEIGESAYLPDGEMDRRLLSRRIFSDPEARLRLQSCVHEAVRRDIRRWRDALAGAPVALVESAILHSSALDRLVDRIWLVRAPEPLRVSRVMARSSLSRDEVLDRIKAQQAEFDSLPPGMVSVVPNDGLTPVLPLIDRLLQTENS